MSVSCVQCKQVACVRARDNPLEAFCGKKCAQVYYGLAQISGQEEDNAMQGILNDILSLPRRERKDKMLTLSLQELHKVCSLDTTLATICSNERFKKAYIEKNRKRFVYDFGYAIAQNIHPSKRNDGIFKEWVVLAIQENVWDPAKDSSSVLWMAVSTADLQILRFLLQDGRAQPTSEMLFSALYRNYTRVLEMLITDGRADPTYNDNALIMRAWADRKREAFYIFYNDPRARNAMAPDDLDYFSYAARWFETYYFDN